MTPKNLLFIFTDEQSRDTLRTYGNRQISTPNLDALAADSVIFENAYVTQPVCTPSRSALLTGLYPHTNGCTENNIPLSLDTPCFPELDDFSDYRVGYIGKWHLGDEVYPQHGFDTWISIEDGYEEYCSSGRDRCRRSDYHRFLEDRGFEPDTTNGEGNESFSRNFAAGLGEELSKAHFVAGETARFLREQNQKPFVLFVNFLEPHMPFFGPRNDHHDVDEIPLPGSFADDLEKSPLKARLFQRSYLNRGHSGLELKTESDWRRMICNYWGLVSLVDAQIGRIIEALEASGKADDTIVVFTSDHGDMMGAHRLLAKCTMFEEAITVPLLLRIPGLESGGRRIPDPVSQIDLVPTLLDVMSREVPHTIEGETLLPMLQGKLEHPYQRDVIVEWNGMNNGIGDQIGGAKIMEEWLELTDEIVIKAALADPVRTIITPDFKKYSWSHREEDCLYDLKTDPQEMTNLAQEPGHDEEIRMLRRKIEEWQMRTMDPVVFG